MKFFHVSNNSTDNKWTPWINEVISGDFTTEPCSICGRKGMLTAGDIEVRVVKNKGVKWPDAFWCGAGVAGFIVSEKTLEAWQVEGIGEFPCNRVVIQPPYPNLVKQPPPNYFWIDGRKMRGALMDYEASAYLEATLCPECGWFDYNVTATTDRHLSEDCAYTFVEGSWNGAKLFTTNMSFASFFCTEEVLKCAAKHKLTNFRFIPVEEGWGIWSKGVDYMKLYGKP